MPYKRSGESPDLDTAGPTFECRKSAGFRQSPDQAFRLEHLGAPTAGMSSFGNGVPQASARTPSVCARARAADVRSFARAAPLRRLSRVRCGLSGSTNMPPGRYIERSAPLPSGYGRFRETADVG